MNKEMDYFCCSFIFDWLNRNVKCEPTRQRTFTTLQNTAILSKSSDLA